MNPSRRLIVSGVPLVAVGCSALPAGTTNVEQFIAGVSAWLPFVSAGVLGVAAFVPQAAPFLPEIQAGLTAVSGILNTMSTGMTAAAAQTPAQQIVTAITTTMATVHQAVGVVPAGSQAKVTAIVAQADAVAASLALLVQNLSAVAPPTVTAQERDMHLVYVRKVR